MTNMFEQLKDSRYDDTFPWKLAYLETSLAIPEQNILLFGEFTEMKDRFRQYEAALDNLQKRMSIGDWNPRYPNHNEGDLIRGCSPLEVLDYSRQQTSKGQSQNPKEFMKQSKMKILGSYSQRNSSKSIDKDVEQIINTNNQNDIGNNHPKIKSYINRKMNVKRRSLRMKRK